MTRFPGASLPRRRPVRTLFLGMTLSRLGESLTVVSLIWIVFEETQSAAGVALAQFAYTALIPVGGLFVGARARPLPGGPGDGRRRISQGGGRRARDRRGARGGRDRAGRPPRRALPRPRVDGRGRGPPDADRRRGPAGRPPAREPARFADLVVDRVRRADRRRDPDRDRRPARGARRRRGVRVALRPAAARRAGQPDVAPAARDR